MDREKIKRELGALIQKGMDIFAASYQDYDKNIYKNVDAERAVKLKEIAEKMRDPKGEYYDWYHEACRVIRTFAPERLTEFERFYIGDTTIKKVDDLNLITSGTTHYLQGWIMVKGEEKTDFFYNFQSYFKAQRYILMAVVGNIDSKLSNLESGIHYEIYHSEMDIARDLRKRKFYRAAGSITGVVIEVHLKKVIASRNLELDVKDPTMFDYNNALKKNKIYGTATFGLIDMCGHIRNKCVHPKEEEPTAGDISSIISGAERILVEVH